MKRRPLEMQGFTRSTDTLLAGAETAKVLGRLGRHVRPELHLDAALGRATDGDVKEDNGVLGHGGVDLCMISRSNHPHGGRQHERSNQDPSERLRCLNLFWLLPQRRRTCLQCWATTLVARCGAPWHTSSRVSTMDYSLAGLDDTTKPRRRGTGPLAGSVDSSHTAGSTDL